MTCDEIGAIYIDSCDSLLLDIINAVLSKIFSAVFEKKKILMQMYIYIYTSILIVTRFQMYSTSAATK